MICQDTCSFETNPLSFTLKKLIALPLRRHHGKAKTLFSRVMKPIVKAP